MKIKKLIAVCLTVVMVCAMMCIPAFAAYESGGRDNPPYNEVYSKDADAFIFVDLATRTADGVSEQYYFDIPVSVNYLEADDPLYSVQYVDRADILSANAESFYLGEFDFTDVAYIYFNLYLYLRLPDGSYQISCIYPYLTSKFVFSDGASGECDYKKFGISKNGNYVEDFGSQSNSAFQGGGSYQFDVVNGDLYKFQFKSSASSSWYQGLLGHSGGLTLELSPLTVYVGEPLDNGALFPPPAPIKDFMGNVATIFHSAINWVALTAETIVSNPLILIFSIVPYIGLGISIYARIKRSKK